MKNLIIIVLIFSFLLSKENNISSGPMVGYSEKMEVGLWIQTTKKSEVKFIYWDIDNPEIKFETESIVTNKNSAFTVTLIADQVKPGTVYHYQPIINKSIVSFDYTLEFQTQEHWEYRKDAPNFSFAVGSCAYTNEIEKDRPGKSYGGDYFIYSNILKKNPDFMIWLGDNVYFREPDGSKTGVYHRYTHDRSLLELQPLLGSVHHYAIWDDHDYGPNNSDRSFIHKNITLQAFKDFWANPSYGIGSNEGITTQFKWSDIDFFLLDNRFFRTPENRKHIYKEILGKDQVEWLIDALLNSKAPFKIIALGGQFLNSEKVYENHINWSDEYKNILDLIEKEKIEGVIFMSGDRHFSEVSKMDRYNNSYPLYDFTVSPLTSGFCDICKNEKNKYRIPGSGVFQRNFAIFKISGENKNRNLDYTIFNNKGEPLWNYIIHEDDLKYEK
jgi:alkaline phosphatase D